MWKSLRCYNLATGTQTDFSFHRRWVYCLVLPGCGDRGTHAVHAQVQIAFVHYQTIQNTLRTVPPGSRVVIERSIESSLIFAQLGVQHNYISNDEYKLLALLVECLQTKLNAEFNIVNSHVYIVCDPLQCYRQAVLRNRAAEHTLQQADVSHLHQMHEVFCQGQIRVKAEDVQDIVNTIVCI